MDGLLPSPEHLPSDAAFLDTRSWHATVRVWEPPPRVVEQAPKLPRFLSYGLFLPASMHILSATAVVTTARTANSNTAFVDRPGIAAAAIVIVSPT